MSQIYPVSSGKKHIFYFDALRALAIVAVLIFHLYTTCNVLVLNQYSTFPSFNWLFTDFIAADFRFGVDLFLMLSGALILGRKTDLKSFFSKRIPRIAIPFVFWVVVLAIASVCISFIIPQWVPIDPAHFNLDGFLSYLYTCFMGKTRGFTHLWFFWMILVVYLLMPVFNKWVLSSDLKEIEYFLVIWFIVCIFHNTLNLKFPIEEIAYFSGPIGMVLLGYYLRYTDRKIFNNPRWAFIALVVVAILAWYSSYVMSSPQEMIYFDNYSLSNIILVAAIFILFKHMDKLGFGNNPNSILHRTTVSLSKYSYGIYLVHRLVLSMLILCLFGRHIPYILLLVMLFVLTLIITWAILAVLNRVPRINKMIM